MSSKKHKDKISEVKNAVIFVNIAIAKDPFQYTKKIIYNERKK